MKKALVLGASGGMGYCIVKELLSRGVRVTAFATTKEKLENLFKNEPNVTIVAGDIFHKNELEEAAKEVDVIFQSANIPYPEWEEKLALLMENILAAAKKQGAKLAVVENIYAYGRSEGMNVKETHTKNPHTKKGKIRLQIENTIQESGVRALIAHFPDFYGPNAENTILHYTLKNIVANKRAGFVGDQTIAREYIYTPDGAKAIVNLAYEDQAYGQNWNVPGYGVITGQELIATIREITGYQKSVSTISKNMIRFLGFFNGNMREVVEMFYLNEEPVVLDGGKYEELLGDVPRTSYRKGLQQTIQYMKENA